LRASLEKQFFLVFIFAIGTCLSANAQLNARFVADNMGGCSPFTVHFTNTSSASSNAVYLWDFGNGNTSILKDPGAVFLEPKAYTVTLTITDGNQTSISSQTITVYNKPTIDFSSSLQKVCTPDPTTFTAKATADGGSIANYLWDFGDGYTQGSYEASVSHAYLTAGEPQVRLSVTDNHGCTSSKTIDNLITVFNGVNADFDADKTFICFQPDPVQMINKSEGEGPLKYSWDFGDGNLSTQKDPSHVFSKKGSYTVSLAIENPNGCKSSLVKTSYLNVGNFKSSLDIPDVICKNAAFEIKNTSTPKPTSFSILVDGQKIYTDYYGKYTYTFTTAGEHTIQLTNQFGDCEETITKKVTIKELLQLKGFIADITQECTEPITVNFTDTTTGAVKSEWNLEPYYYPVPIQATGKKVSYNFQAGIRNVTLFVTDANGCQNSIEQPVNLKIPNLYIQTTDNNGNNGCDTLTKTFKAITDEDIISYNWDFGDGSFSNEAEPSHTFHFGNINNVVTLTYTTAKGCTTQAYYTSIQVYPKVKAGFVSEFGTEICGNSKVWFKTGYSQTDYWIIDGKYAGSSNYNSFNYQFQDTGKHTITQIVYEPGCRDTLTRVDYIHVTPSFPKITDAINTCDDDRATIIFKHASRYTESGIWDFGDGSTAPFNKDETAISHHYAASGDYKVVLTNTNGLCTNKDSLFDVPVILNTNLVLSSYKPDFCQEEGLSYSLSNLPQERYSFGPNYYVHSYQYNDGTEFLLGNNTYDFENWIIGPDFNNIFKNVAKGKDSIRIVSSVEMFVPTPPFHIACLDTTNFIPVQLTGAIARFEIVNNVACFKSPFFFNDISTSTNTTIINRQWNFGDGDTITTSKGGIVSHTYSEPGTYYVSLTITDASGCTYTDFISHMVTVNGPKANFVITSLVYHLNTAVQFYNSTNEFGVGSRKYEWDFGDGQTSTEFNPVYTFTKPGDYTIRLIAKSLTTGCDDTASKKITIKNFNANFSFTSSFVDHIDCSSLLVQFVNTSVNFTHIKWDFGDGFISDNVNTPSHVYEKPGKYIVKLFVTGNNGLSKTYIDSVIVRDEKVNITANLLQTCTAQSVTLSAVSQNASSYLWDFGDGTLAQASDTFSVHYYKTPGNYIPKLIAKDPDGCAASVMLTNKISIDSLNVSLKTIPKICAPKEVQFDLDVTSIGSGQGQQSLSYHWDFGTGNKIDTANIETPSFTYQQPGNYIVSVQIKSPAGCVKQTETNIVAFQGLGGQINGPSDICVETTAQFTGRTLIAGQPSWKWIFDDGTVVNEKDPPAKQYNAPGNFMVKLVVDNGGCIDTVNKLLQVHAKPNVALSLSDTTICEGTSISVIAGGGSFYSWSPVAGLNATNGATVIASPLNNTIYNVAVSDTFGCSSNASLSIKIIHPFSLQLGKEMEVCSGTTARLQASGGVSYQWINNIDGLNNISIPDPVVTPLQSSIYTLVAFAQNQCFADTAQINVTVKPTPVVHLGNDTTICEGQNLILKAYANNATYVWQDGSNAADYPAKKSGRYYVWVDLNNCKASDTINITQKEIPNFSLGKDSAICIGEKYVLAPSLNTNASFLWQDGSTASSFVVMQEGIYELTATNECGSHSDAVTITKGLCNLLMPNAFTPNNDNLNDVFDVKFPFAVTNFHFVVTNRWGQAVFETTDIHKGWDGTFQGLPAPGDIYLWVISFTDINNKSQQQKGTVTLLR